MELYDELDIVTEVKRWDSDGWVIWKEC
jgi:hypothetical protein